jgi:Protein of unknown function VcgC/VcgE (DUF2780)
MNRRTALLAALTLPLAARAQSLSSLTDAVKDPLVGALKSKFGITDDQAKGGIGSYLTLAQEKLAKGDFDKVASYIPGASKYMDSAKQLGAVAGPLGNVAGLNGALGKLGMNADTVAKFTPTVTNYISKAGGGSSLAGKLAGVFK